LIEYTEPVSALGRGAPLEVVVVELEVVVVVEVLVVELELELVVVVVRAGVSKVPLAPYSVPTMLVALTR
jgi:hypothetical protein